MKTLKRNNEELVRLFLRNGVIRRPNKERLKEGYQHYKKGYEIRWTANNKKEETAILQMLNSIGFKYGKPFEKFKRVIIPVYGYELLMEFQKILSKHSCVK